MALVDYKLCDNCDAKVFYDAEVNWDDMAEGARVLAYCPECAPRFVVIDTTAVRVLIAQVFYRNAKGGGGLPWESLSEDQWYYLRQADIALGALRGDS